VNGVPKPVRFNGDRTTEPARRSGNNGDAQGGHSMQRASVMQCSQPDAIPVSGKGYRPN
jgi:hypothetical protein